MELDSVALPLKGITASRSVSVGSFSVQRTIVIPRNRGAGGGVYRV
jgi:hypothetical protein